MMETNATCTAVVSASPRLGSLRVYATGPESVDQPRSTSAWTLCHLRFATQVRRAECALDLMRADDRAETVRDATAVHEHSATRSTVGIGGPRWPPEFFHRSHFSSLLSSRNASVSALPRSWNTTVSVDVITAPA